MRTLPSGQLPDPVCRDSLSCLGLPYSALPPCPPHSEADELAAQGADREAELPPVLPGDSDWAAREAAEAEAGLYLGAGSSWGGQRRGRAPATAPGLHRAPSPCLGTIQSQPPRPMLPSSVPSWGPAYLGAGQQPHSTGRHWKRSRSAGAAPRDAGQPRPDCWPSGGRLERGRVRLGGEVGEGCT